MDNLYIIARNLRNYALYDLLIAVRRVADLLAEIDISGDDLESADMDEGGYTDTIIDCENIFRHISTSMPNLTLRQQTTLLRLSPVIILLIPKPTKRQICYAVMRVTSLIRNLDVSRYQTFMKKKLEIFKKNDYSVNPLYMLESIPLYMQEYVLYRKHLLDISEFTEDMQADAFALDYRYFAHYEISLHTLQLYNKLFDVSLNKDPTLIKKLLEYDDSYWVKLQQLRPVEKYITAHPHSVKYFLNGDISMIQQCITLSVSLDPTTIVYVRRGIPIQKIITAEFCLKAIKRNPSIILWVIKTGKFRGTNELKLMMATAVELNPELISDPMLQTKHNIAIATLSKKRRYLHFMFDLCIALHDLNLPDVLLFYIFDELYDQALRDIDKWHITRIVKRQPLRI